jgi:hypothetical protein
MAIDFAPQTLTNGGCSNITDVIIADFQLGQGGVDLITKPTRVGTTVNGPGM